MNSLIISENFVETFFASKRNANSIIELEKFLLSDSKDDIIHSMLLTKEVFTEIFRRNYFHGSTKTGASQEKFKLWLLDRYYGIVAHLLTYMLHSDGEIQIEALNVLMQFVTLEGGKPLKDISEGRWFFPKQLYQKIVANILSHDVDQINLIGRFENCYALYDDIKMYTLKAVLDLMDQTEVTDVFLLNCFNLLACIKYPTHFSSLEEASTLSQNTLLSQEGIKETFHLKEKVFCKLFSNAWLRFLKHSLPSVLIKKVLVIAHKKIVPHLQNPCLLTDFLTDSYNHGGVVSLLALHGLFVLMQRYNVEYPDFYHKLYSLFDENIVNGKFSSKFFYLMSLFLSSTHIPAYMMAAFVKKLSRISLRSKIESILKIVPLICRLLVLHPTLNILVNQVNGSGYSRDPFNFDELDPAKSGAMESSLWEIKSLQKHVNPEVSRKAKIINLELPKQEFDLSSVIDLSTNKLYKAERKRKFMDAPISISKPSKCMKWSNFHAV